ncbi:MAG TPA: DUF5668 domain-containing protein [Arenimonas sp.]|nr:DUF5668 domain-containing protein [Arenimonas sp.]
MNPQRNQSQVILGVIVLMLGVLFLADNLSSFSIGRTIGFWPAIFIAIGTVKLYQARNTNQASSYALGGGLLLVGLLLVLNNSGIIHFRLRDWWPAVLIVVGASVLWRGVHADRERSRPDGSAPRDGRINAVAVMAGNEQRFGSGVFRGGDVTAVLGAVELDLRQAQVEGEVRLHVFAFWGGIDIQVPPDWEVVVNGVPLLGAIEVKSLPPMQSDKRLVIEGWAVMGAVEVKS